MQCRLTDFVNQHIIQWVHSLYVYENERHTCCNKYYILLDIYSQIFCNPFQKDFWTVSKN